MKMSDMKYSIGQVLFIVLNKKSQVYPMRVIEVITKKTLRGEDVKFLLQGGTDASATVMLDAVDGEVFDSAESARRTLIDRATKQINKIVDIARTKAREWYGEETSDTESSSYETIHDLPDLSAPVTATDVEPLYETVTLPDGTVARLKIHAGSTV